MSAKSYPPRSSIQGLCCQWGGGGNGARLLLKMLERNLGLILTSGWDHLCTQNDPSASAQTIVQIFEEREETAASAYIFHRGYFGCNEAGKVEVGRRVSFLFTSLGKREDTLSAIAWCLPLFPLSLPHLAVIKADLRGKAIAVSLGWMRFSSETQRLVVNNSVRL